MQYDKTRIQEMVQEIKGTVKVEGTVEVTGTVKVEGVASIGNYLKRAQMALAEENWAAARKFFENALNIDAECAEAYLGIMLTQNTLRSTDELSTYTAKCLKDNPNYEKVMRFGTAAQKQLLANWEKYYTDFCDREAAAKEAEFTSKNEHLKPVRQYIEAFQSGIISSKGDYLLGLKTDGTVLFTGVENSVSAGVATWENIAFLAAGTHHALGICDDGTVVATGKNDCGQCDVLQWNDIIAVAAGSGHSVGLRQDGTVVAVGNNGYGQCNVESWEQIIAIATGCYHTVGLKKDGTVVATGRNHDERGNHAGQCNVSNWTNIVSVAAGFSHTVGARADGSVVAAGSFGDKRREVDQWTDIVAVAAGDKHTVGLKSDGTVQTTGVSDRNINHCVDDWDNIIALAAYGFSTIGLKADGSVVTIGHKLSEWHTARWKLFKNMDALEQECREARRNREEQRIAQQKREEEERLAQQKREEEELAALRKQEEEWQIAVQRLRAGLCRHCGGELKGLFSKSVSPAASPKITDTPI